jgi:hypothetical protein
MMVTKNMGISLFATLQVHTNECPMGSAHRISHGVSRCLPISIFENLVEEILPKQAPTLNGNEPCNNLSEPHNILQINYVIKETIK